MTKTRKKKMHTCQIITPSDYEGKDLGNPSLKGLKGPVAKALRDFAGGGKGLLKEGEDALSILGR